MPQPTARLYDVFAPCPACGSDEMTSLTYPHGVTWYPDGQGASFPTMEEAVLAMANGEHRCRTCGWIGYPKREVQP